MARASTADFLQNFRFHAKVNIEDGVDADALGFSAEGKYQTEAGFNSVSTPEYSIESTEYRDGITTYTMKQPGFPTVNELTFSRGVVLKDTTFLDWALRVWDNQAYRADIDIYHYGKQAVESKSGGFDASKGRIIKAYNAYPIRVKPAADLDATGTDIALQEMDVAFEYFEIIKP